MTQTNQRSLERFKLEHPPAGRLTLRSPAGQFALEEINNISESGISFTLNHPEPVASRVAIEFADGKIKFEVFGRVAWCAKNNGGDANAAGPQTYAMGVELLTTTMLFAMLKNG
jgi:PilZ domain